ncbi:MAG: tellurite resistance TerB family protein [Hyphomonadaceae bacterium]
MAEFFAASLGKAQPGNVLDFSALLAQPPQSTEGWSAPEAFTAILIGAVTCDGELAAVEHEELLALAHRSRALKALSPGELGELSAKAAARLSDEPDALRSACAALPEDMRQPVFAHALDLVLADGELNADEADFLNTLILALKLERDDVSKITDVIVLKNRY